MTEPEQWRFQWPDGTWIRWNPQTQSWEKEAAGVEAPPASEITTPAPVQPPVEVVEVEDARVSDEPALEPPEVEGPGIETFPSRRERRTGRARRSMVGDVLPPQPEPERAGASLWPTVITGMIVGLGVGLLIWNVIR